jgi:ubiquitin-conjugating enzyme E2 O
MGELYVDDLCRSASTSLPFRKLCVVDRAAAEVNSHAPYPAKSYGTIAKEDDIPDEQFQTFLKTGRPPVGTVLVTWFDGTHMGQLVSVASLELVHREFLIGDAVKIDPKAAITGTVIDREDYYDLAPVNFQLPVGSEHWLQRCKLPDRNLLRIPTNELKPVQQFSHLEDLIVYKNWLGRLTEIKREITLRLRNNSVVVVADASQLDQTDQTINPHIQLGDIVTSPKRNLRKGKWTVGAYDHVLENVGQVIDIKITRLTVSWIARRLDMPRNSTSTSSPPEILDTHELESGEVRVVPRRSGTHDQDLFQRVRFDNLPAACAKYNGKNDAACAVNLSSDSAYYLNHLRATPTNSTMGYDLNVFSVVSFSSMLTIRWQDSSTSKHLSRHVHPQLEYVDGTEFFPGQIVLPKPATENLGSYCRQQKVGVVQSVSAHERIARVLWSTTAQCDYLVLDTKEMHLESGFKTGFPVQPSPFGSGYYEDIPVFDLVLAPGINRQLEDIVFLQAESDQKSFKTHSTEWIGSVSEVNLDGTITVTCNTGKAQPKKTVAPEATVVVVPAGDLWYGPDSEITDDEMSCSGSSTNDGDLMDIGEDEAIETWAEDESGELLERDPDEYEEEWSTEEENGSLQDVSMDLDHVTLGNKTTTDERGECRSPENNFTAGLDIGPTALIPHNPDIPQYDILESSPPSDHHYLSSVSSNSAAQRLKRIRKEHAVLRESLPEGVYVRSWESRLDLFRILFIGPVDTPYEYAPFIIDFLLPEEFPHSPPKAFFHSWNSGNGPINPNLYEDGKVCLSLLNTWHGEAKESWSTKSTFLQVIVSILGLVLVERPYYNEAGYEVLIGSDESKIPAAQHAEKIYFQSRAFITHALQVKPDPFGDILSWLYLEKSGSTPQLLQKATEALQEVVADDGKGNVKRGGLSTTVSKGAMVMFKRHLEALQKIPTIQWTHNSALT